MFWEAKSGVLLSIGKTKPSPRCSTVVLRYGELPTPALLMNFGFQYRKWILNVLSDESDREEFPLPLCREIIYSRAVSGRAYSAQYKTAEICFPPVQDRASDGLKDRPCH